MTEPSESACAFIANALRGCEWPEGQPQAMHRALKQALHGGIILAYDPSSIVVRQDGDVWHFEATVRLTTSDFDGHRIQIRDDRTAAP